jgi:flagellar biosynthesis/type III secretory pathway protein FliH
MGGSSSRVLKKGCSAPTAGGAADELVEAARERAGKIVAAAESEAEALRAGAAEGVERARRAAVEAGYAEGLARAAAALALVAEARAERLAALDSVVVEVALDVARRIIGQELAAAPGAAVEMGRRALRAAAGCGDVVLRVAGADLAAVREAGDALARLVERGSLTLLEDHSLAPGEVVVESAAGRVDARVDAQLEAFRRALEPEVR